MERDQPEYAVILELVFSGLRRTPTSRGDAAVGADIPPADFDGGKPCSAFVSWNRILGYRIFSVGLSPRNANIEK